MKKTALWIVMIPAAVVWAAVAGTEPAAKGPVSSSAGSVFADQDAAIPVAEKELRLLDRAPASAPAAVSIQVVEDPATLPPALAEVSRKGDFLVTDGKCTAVIASSIRPSFSTINYGHPDVSGYVQAFLPEGASRRVEAQIGVPSVRINDLALPVGPAVVERNGSEIVARMTCESASGPLEIRTRYGFAFASGRLTVVSEIRNAGPNEVTGLSFGLGANACQNFNFSPFNAGAFPKLNIRVWQRPDHSLGWHNPNPPDSAKNPLPGRLRPGQVHRVSYSLLTGADPIGVLNGLYALTGVKTEAVSLEFGAFEGLTEVLVREPATGAVFFRTFMDKPAPLTVPLPRGTYEARAHFFPAVVGKTFAVDGTPAEKPMTLEPPEFGRVRVSIADRKGNPVLGKVSFIGLAPSASPSFRPENPIATGRSWEGTKTSVFPLRETPDVTLPAGTYLATSSRGPEYTLETRVVEIVGGENPPLEFRLDKVVDTRGLLSIDTHMHTQHSDGSMLVPERLRSAVAEGLEAAVASDHNVLVDYRPDLGRLGLTDDLAVIVGTEVTARTGSIHYNTYPLAIRPGEPGNGAISVRNETPDDLFDLSRSKDPGTLIQVNHPRSRGLGYFLTYDLDREAAASAKAPFSMDFDVMEVMNGAAPFGDNMESVEDFFHFLNRGYPVRAVGTSDAHGIDGGETGYSRTYVLYDGPKGAALDRAAVVAAIKEGRSFVSTGPIVSVRSGRNGLGDLIEVKKGRIDLDLRVTGAPWLDVSEVRLVVNGERREPLPIEGADGQTVKFRDKVRLELERDAWIAVEVRGRTSLYPLIQQRSGNGTAERAIVPYALTNPLFADVDGNGRYDPVWPEKVAVK